jgi:hypothetical protein
MRGKANMPGIEDGEARVGSLLEVKKTPKERAITAAKVTMAMLAASFLSAWRCSKQQHRAHFTATTVRVGAFVGGVQSSPKLP